MQQEAQKYYPLPTVGDIVWCKFPESLGNPGPKGRPALVVRVSKEDHAIAVIYGTSQKVNKIYPTEFLISDTDQMFADSGLSFSTKFDTEHLVTLPFDTDWFEISPSPNRMTPLPKIGVLHISYQAKLLAARQEALKKAK